MKFAKYLLPLYSYAMPDPANTNSSGINNWKTVLHIWRYLYISIFLIDMLYTIDKSKKSKVICVNEYSFIIRCGLIKPELVLQGIWLN